MYGQGGGFDRPERNFAPVKVGDELNVKIEAVGEKGDGIAKKDGFVLFVPNTKEGEQVKVRVTKVLRKVGFAEVVGKSEGSIESQKADSPDSRRQEKEMPDDSEEFGEAPAEDIPEPEEENKDLS
ncbi:MAG: TRAM domain-containing protein [Nanoarchaeota archaeon]|nr:TRAM domain-containing protein [Nanoarchaeota archaeon]